MPSITPDEARETLADIDQITRQMKQTLASPLISFNLIVWGLIWIAGFLSSYLFSKGAGRIWVGLDLLGIGCSLAMGLAQRRHLMIRSEQARKLGHQILLFWAAMIGYAFLMVFTLPHGSGVDRLVLIVSILMLGYVVMGIWLRSPILSLIGLGVTLATVTGRHFIPPREFMLWMAIFGGGGLLLSGLYVRLRWK